VLDGGDEIMAPKPAKPIRAIAVRKTDGERLLDVRRAVDEGIFAIAIPKRPKRKRRSRSFTAIVLK
jgi:hypothetical protein